ncbi:peptidoglycan-binding protein [Plectonema radiosum NIES-515]|uniref:Peptidoglycan-binding protein n=1 Tax=Plectonema radiosum NIES-515 TaxID=2986073 RepID=A0ABT3AYP4_9CYAN|nr:peptidoglycan-binding protein [Plectonema radiosum]MCV3214105.1 peptidoglycan-binding protein [Plectonema radiosum NIES-515]
METIGNFGVVSTDEASKSIEVVPLGVDFKFFHNWRNFSIAGMRLLSVALTMGILSIAGQAMALQKLGSSGNDVTNTQRCLKKLGYFKAPVTGNFASLTQKAVIGFQRAKKLPADGVVGISTERSLQQACLAKNSSGNVGKNPGSNVTGDLRQGSKGASVSKLQQNLRQLGYFNGRIDGYFGLDTQQAVIKFQQASRLRADGVVGSRTIQAILIKRGEGEGGEYPVLSENSSGLAVTRLQQLLKQRGYFNTNPTGRFGPITRDAVIAFQRNSGLPANGVANRQTWDALLITSQEPTPAGVSLSTEQIRELQQRLRDLGYLNTNPTGNVSPLTIDALRRFQQDYRLYADGIADSQILEAVRRAWEDRYANQNQPNKNYISVGDTGENVKALQERLTQLGYYNAYPDGYFSEYTRSSVIAFQQYYRLNPTGVVDSQTWQVLGFNGSPVANRPNNNRYVVVVPISHNDTLNIVRQYVPNAFLAESRLGNYVNAGAFSDRTQAEQRSRELRSRGLDARVDYF